MATAMTLLTAEEFAKLPSSRWSELIDGVVVEMSPPAPEHGGIARTVFGLLWAYVRPRALGRVITEAGFIIRRNPDLVRAPDVPFIRTVQIPPTGLPRQFWNIAPDLVVEVVSPSDTRAEVLAKVREWIEAGVRTVWVAYPISRTIEVVRSLQERVTLGIGATLDGGDVVPGFSCPVAEIFE
jgi:Uma2 family endonuclease